MGMMATVARRGLWGKASMVALAIVLLVSSESLPAATQTSSGSVQMSAQSLLYGSSYTVDYQVQSQAVVGQNATFTLTLYVDNVTGEGSYVLNYELVVTIYVDLAHVLTGSVLGQAPAAPFLYPGAHWGPETVSIPLTQENTGIQPGASKNVSLSIAIEDEVWLGYPVEYNVPTNAQGSMGSMVISSPGGESTPALGYILAAAGLAVVAVAVVLLWRDRASQRGADAQAEVSSGPATDK